MRCSFMTVFAASMIALLGCGEISQSNGETPKQTETKPSKIIALKDWAAWINLQPPGPARLYVTGEVQLPHPGFDVSLERAVPQGINPKILMLNLVVKEREGMHAQVITWHKVRFEESAEKGQLTEVSVLHQGQIVQGLPVEEAH